jgi:hypothetical protein
VPRPLRGQENAERPDYAQAQASFEHLERWCVRNARPHWTAALEDRTLPHDLERTRRVAGWAYAQAESGGATVWQQGGDGLVKLDRRRRAMLLP